MRGAVRVHLGAKGNLWSRSESYIDVGSIADKCPRFQENPLSSGEDVGCLLKELHFLRRKLARQRLRSLQSSQAQKIYALVLGNCFLRK